MNIGSVWQHKESQASCEVQLFDSLLASKDVGVLIVLQAACLYKKYSQMGNLRIRFMPSQQQDGIVDCGLYSSLLLQLRLARAG